VLFALFHRFFRYSYPVALLHQLTAGWRTQKHVFATRLVSFLV